MKVLEGFEVEEQTEDKLVIVKRFGSNGNGLIRITGNPHPDPEARRAHINKLIAPLYDIWESTREETVS